MHRPDDGAIAHVECSFYQRQKYYDKFDRIPGKSIDRAWNKCLDTRLLKNIRRAALVPFLTELVTDRFSSRKLIHDRTIGKYLITGIIGQGGYSIVYKGLPTGLKMPAAIKMMKHDLAMGTALVFKFWKEAEIIVSLNHENIIK